MSTILNALRKAKQEPPKETVDARREILAERAHDYLATVPDDPEAKLRTMKILVALAGGVVVLLAGVVVYLIMMMPGRNEDQPSSLSAAALPPPAPALAATPAVRETPPPPARLEIVVSTPAPSPTPVPSPSPTPIPPPPQPTPAPSVSGPAENTTPETTVAEPGETPSAMEGERDLAAFRRVSALRLYGIIWSSADPVAMIDGQAVREGAYISGILIKKINRDSVEVVLDGQTFTLRP